MATLLGGRSPKLSAVRALRTKKGRREQGRFAVEGETLLREALDAGWTPEALFATEPAHDRHPWLQTVAAGGLYVVPERSLGQISDVDSPTGIIAVFEQRLLPLEEAFGEGPVALLAGVADPGNAGTLIRSAEAFGLSAVVFADDAVEPYNPKVVRASMGSIFRLPVALDVSEAIFQAAARHGFTTVATSRRGRPLGEVRFPGRSLIAVGNERHGLGEWAGRYDFEVAIPQSGKAESLNAAVAGSIVFYACMQQFAAAKPAESKGLEP